MSERKKMSDTLRRLQDLYEGRLDDEDVSEAGRSEIDDLREVKDLLDRRPKRRPDSSAVAAVLSAARGDFTQIESRSPRVESFDSNDDPPRGKRVDRPPHARRQSAVLRIGTVSALVALLLGVVGILQLDLLSPDARSTLDWARQNHAGGAEEHSTPAAEEPTAVASSTNEQASDNESADDQLTSNAATGNGPAGEQGSSDEAGLSFAEQRSEIETSSGGATVQRAESVRTNSASSASTATDGLATVPLSERSAVPAAHRNLTTAFVDSFSSPPSQLGPVSPQVAALESAERSDVLTWDQQGDVMEVYQHIEMIGGDVAMEWESPPIPLEMMPANRSSDRFVRPAGEGRRP